MKTAEETKEIYFGFYDQLIEPYCSQAKEMYTGNQVFPKSVKDAIWSGINWATNKQGDLYWRDVVLNIDKYIKPIDMVNHPNHYGGDSVYEYFKVAEAWGWHKRAYLWNAGKYMCRTGKKSKDKEIEDLEEAIVYLNKEIELLKNGD